MRLRHASTFPFAAAVMCVAASASLAACGDASAPGDVAGVDAEEPAAARRQALSAPLDIDPLRSLILTKATDPLAMARFQLEDVFNQLIAGAELSSQQSAVQLYRSWWDFFNGSATAHDPDAIHCDDQTNSAGITTINGYRIACGRREGRLAVSDPFDPNSADFVEPIAVVNRFDLAPRDGSHCGEYRIVYAKKSAGIADRNLFILEAQLPNPHPECGIDACLPVAEFWASLSSMDANERAEELETFFMEGLEGTDFDAVLHPDNFADAVHGPAGRRGTGQIRTNQFMGDPNSPHQAKQGQIWQLREFKLAKTPGGERLYFKPVTVKDNPYGPLFSTNVDPSDFRYSWFMDDFLESVDELTTLSTDINDIKLTNSRADLYNAGESTVDRSNDYLDQLLPAVNYLPNLELRDRIQAELVRLGRDSIFTPADVANRATTQSCAGCHQLSGGDSLGNGVTWPEEDVPVGDFGRFVHVREDGNLSRALTEFFLPHREGVLEAFLAAHVNGNTCSTPTTPAALAVAGDEPVPTLGGATTH
ncbi:hypothetical protein [Sorangium sp. So ce1335]|uniref:hypothetical protein n=1 Tax=Sorangium sp. So ce1335 TaxID=3133335 RepID=UPI003F63BCCA